MKRFLVGVSAFLVAVASFAAPAASHIRIGVPEGVAAVVTEPGQAVAIMHDSLNVLRAIERRCDEHPQFVHHPRREERAVRLGPAFDHEVLDPELLCKQCQRARDVDLDAR